MKTKLFLAALFAAVLSLVLSNTNGGKFSVAAAAPPSQNSLRAQGRDLRGTCIWQEVKFPTTTGDQQVVGPATILASVTFDGNGAITMDYDTNINGAYTSTNGVLGSYSLDSAGHGSFTFTSPASGFVRTYDFRVSPSGRTIYTMAQSDGTGSVTQRVSTGTCRF